MNKISNVQWKTLTICVCAVLTALGCMFITYLGLTTAGYAKEFVIYSTWGIWLVMNTVVAIGIATEKIDIGL